MEYGCDPESLRIQLGVLQSRIEIHGNRMWQLPLTYLGALVVSISQVDSPKSMLKPWFIFFLLFILGTLLLWCMYGAFEGYQRTAGYMIQVEAELKLPPATAKRISHYLPYFGMLFFGLLFTLGATFHFYD